MSYKVVPTGSDVPPGDSRAYEPMIPARANDPPGLDVPTANDSRALKPNTYGAIALAVTKLYDPANVDKTGKLGLRIAFMIALLFHILSLLLQFGLIFMLLQFTIERRDDKFELDLHDETKHLQSAVSTNMALNKVTYAKELQLCADDHNVPYSQSVMICIWGMKLLPELWQGILLIAVIMRLPKPQQGQEDWIVKDENEKKDNIVCLPTHVKLFIVAVVELPRVAVGICLYWMGAKFLMFAPSLGVLIMKSVGLAFISLIPVIIFQGLFSEAAQKEVGKIQIKFPNPATPGVWWNLWGSSVTKLAIVVVTALYYCRVVHGDLQAFRAACTAYEYHFLVPECSPHCGSHLFGFTFYN